MHSSRVTVLLCGLNSWRYPVRMEPSNLKRDYPSIELVYPIAVNSYEVATKRLDVMDGRLQTITAIMVTVSVAFVGFLGARGVRFDNVWFFVSVVLFLLGVVLGMAGRLIGNVRLLDPETLYDGWLHVQEFEFKKDMIYAAGQAFSQNMRLVGFRWRVSVILTVLFVVQMICLGLWALRSNL